ncbi:hypothetical protein GS947_24290 [Rhodococcus hoagii]|uniref:Uncharacterized protein n=1 Tax=Rhodococcus hoagii TaxID=43767 RepID=A0AAE4ZUH1_RHOHA|nr:hypothetical protein [Prescottella equi]
MSAEKQSFMRWWGRRMLIVLPPWVPAFILMAMGAGVWAYVVGIGGTLLLGESRSASTTRGVAARCELTARGFKISSASMRPFERRIERRCDCSQNGDAARNSGDVSVPRYRV